jgi:hypothetical protein
MSDFDHCDGVRVFLEISHGCGARVSFKDVKVSATMCKCGEEVLNPRYVHDGSLDAKKWERRQVNQRLGMKDFDSKEPVASKDINSSLGKAIDV